MLSLDEAKLLVNQKVLYTPQYVQSRYQGKVVLLAVLNKYGHATIRFLDGPLQNTTRGVKLRDLSRATLA